VKPSKCHIPSMNSRMSNLLIWGRYLNDDVAIANISGTFYQLYNISSNFIFNGPVIILKTNNVYDLASFK